MSESEAEDIVVRATRGIIERDARIKLLEEALSIYADRANWSRSGPSRALPTWSWVRQRQTSPAEYARRALEGEA